ncbi:beta-lactamase/transpeptidase-like protein [Tothia fuscella]|uniref:Beta-lactamase/transpeptidase-like protein n=1 Tax=Tothia fuscella TaxID=1048955 RepID=A0A9P4NW28_9PEZI|nr:beta-lactamase/transpeptidase-like protein [Tothia fuscella]
MTSTFLSRADDRKTEQNHTVLAGAGAVTGSVDDYARYLRAMITEHPVLSKELYLQLRTPRAILPSASSSVPLKGPFTYTLGWRLSVYRNEELYAHSGLLDGFSSYMAYIPAKKRGVVVMANSDVGTDRLVAILALELIDHVPRTPEAEKFDWGLRGFEENNRTNTQGDYWHPGYRSLTLTVANPTYNMKGSCTEADKILHAYVDKQWKYCVDLERVYGGHFPARIYPSKSRTVHCFSGGW